MFPYAMLATTTIFYSNNWPKRLWFFVRGKTFTPTDMSKVSILSSHCIYEKIARNDSGNETGNKKNMHENKKRSSSFYHKFFSFYTIIYLVTQCFLPYSHFITKVNFWGIIKLFY